MQVILQRKPLEPAITLQSTDSTAMKCVLAAIFHWPHLRNHPELWDERHDGGNCCLQTFSTHRLPWLRSRVPGAGRKELLFPHTGTHHFNNKRTATISFLLREHNTVGK